MYLAVDVGGTKTLLAVFSKRGELVEQLKFPTPESYADFLVALNAEVKKFKTTDFDRAVVAIPGLVNRRHGIGVAFGNLPWENVPVQADTEAIFDCPVQVDNDANLAGLSEAHEVIHEFKKVLYVTVSTGIGGVLVVNGVMDPDTLDAEIGHMLLEHDGRLELWQDFASGRAIKAKFGKKAQDITDPKAWYIISRNLAVGLIDVIAAYTPEAIIIGGGVGSHLDKFHDRLVEELKIYENPMVTIPPILQAKRSEEAVIYGCYILARGSHGKPAK